MDSHAVRVTNSLLAAIPSVLGFLPTESVILLATVPGPDGASVLGPVVRADLGPMLAHPAAAQVRARVRPVVIDTLEHIRAQIRACSITELAARALLIDDVVARARTGHLPDDSGSIGALIATLTTPLLRDTQLVRRSTEDGLALENLVLHLWRHASEPCASALAGLVAVLAYQRGDGTGANIALSVVDSPDTFTQLIGQAVGLAVHPSD